MNSSAMQPKDKWIPWYFVIFFVVLAVVNGVMVWLAVRTQPGKVTERAYEKGLAYNQVVQAAETEQALGWSAEVVRDGEWLRVTLHDASGKVFAPDHLMAEISRPVGDPMSFRLDITDGRAKVNFPSHGQWDVRIYAQYEGKYFQKAVRLVVYE